MGNSQSHPGEAVYNAVLKNNVGELDKALRAATPLTGRVLNWVDKEGRTPLMVAAARNYDMCARKLLSAGADVRYQHMDKEGTGESALHLAARGKHENMVDLLLACGANPFVCSAMGRTPTDEAVLAGSSNILRKFEAHALWLGSVAVKSNKLGGLSQPFKPRHLVVLPFYPFPHPGTTEVARRQLWVFKDATSLVPKCQVWLDGSTCVRTGPTDSLLRLHTSHKQPLGDVYTRFDRGYCLFLRPVDNTPDATSGWLHLQDVINGPNSSRVVVAAGVPQLPLTPPPGTAAQAPQAQASHLPPVSALSAPLRNPSGSMAVQPSTPAYNSASSTPQWTPGTATPGSALSSAPHSAAGSAGGGATAQPQTVGFYPPLPVHQPQQTPSSWDPGLDAFTDDMQALPGETDAQFAQRVASAIVAGNSPAGSLSGSMRPSRAQSALPRLSSQHANQSPAAAQLVPPARSSQPARSSSPTVLTATSLLHPALAARQPSDPSAPPLSSDDALCVICLYAPREVGFLHGGSVHRCVCKGCAPAVMARPNAPCPLCRQPIERVLDVY